MSNTVFRNGGYWTRTTEMRAHSRREAVKKSRQFSDGWHYTWFIEQLWIGPADEREWIAIPEVKEWETDGE
jgi:hypothetical protein